MSTVTEIKGDTGNTLKISNEGTIGVENHGHPPVVEKITVTPVARFFTDDGLTSGSNDMRVAGSLAAPLEFYIPASPESDIYIGTVSFEITDAGATLNKFGNISSLTNGVKFSWVTRDKGEVVLDAGMKSNYEFIRLCGGTPSFGATTNAFKANNVNGSSEGYIPNLDISKVFKMPYGFRLRKGTKDKLVFTIQDDTSGVDSFNAKAYGQEL